MRIAIGSDKSGFSLKESVKKFLLNKGYEVADLGTLDPENALPYYEVAKNVAEKVQKGIFERGLLFCGTGMGMALVANKFKGVYAAVVESLYAAQKCRAINNANILTMGGWIVGENMACEMVEVFLETGFTEGLEEWRQEFLKKAYLQVQEVEEKQFQK